MPPALSDDEIGASSGDEQNPTTSEKQSRKADPVEVEEEEEEEQEGENEEDDEEEYVVEAIQRHKFQKGVVLYHVKWQGYDDPKDMTWEGEDNLEGVEALEEYHKSIGGRPDSGKKRKGRKSGVDTETSTQVATKRMKKEQEWAPPIGSWEDEVDHVDTVEQRYNPKTGLPEKFGYLVWKHQAKTQHPLPLIFKKCPQKMLAYFEEHLVFNNADDAEDEEVNGNVNMTGVDDDIRRG